MSYRNCIHVALTPIGLALPTWDFYGSSCLVPESVTRRAGGFLSLHPPELLKVTVPLFRSLRLPNLEQEAEGP